MHEDFDDDQPDDHHQAIIEALATNDPQAARQAMASHIEQMREATLTQAGRALR